MTQELDYSKYGFQRMIKYKGLIDFDGLYKFSQKWMADRDFDFQETKVKDKPPEVWYFWEARKVLTFYVMLIIDIAIKTFDPQEVEITTQAGVKKKMINTRMKLTVSGRYITDFDGDFEKSKGLKKIESFMNDYILYHEILLKYFDYFDYYLHGFMTDLKEFLGMNTASSAY